MPPNSATHDTPPKPGVHELLTTHECAAELRVSIVTLRDFINSGELEAIRLRSNRPGRGRTEFRISREALEKFKAERTVGAKHPPASKES